MNLYNDNRERINTAALFASLDYDQDAQQIERGEFYSYVNDLVGVYGGMKK